MKHATLGAIIGLCLLSSGTVFAADGAKTKADNVTVVFDHPEKFADVKDEFMGTDKGRDAILEGIRTFITERSASCLKEGQKLDVKFTDIDLAGEFEPQRGPNFDRVRIMKNIYAPRFDLEFKLTGADGKVLNEGKRTLRDSYYMDRMIADKSDPLCYDKDILNDWLRSDIKPKAAAAH